MGALDVMIGVKRDALQHIAAQLELLKDGEPGLTFTSALREVEIGVNRYGKPITACVVEPVEDAPAKPKKFEPRLSDGTMKVLHALEAALADEGEIPPAGNHVPPQTRTVSPDKWREYFYKMSALDKEDSKHKAFKRGEEKLTALGRVAVWEPYAWIVRSDAGHEALDWIPDF
jgi:hypothetical protein